jgi:hypothetical protein
MPMLGLEVQPPVSAAKDRLPRVNLIASGTLALLAHPAGIARLPSRAAPVHEPGESRDRPVHLRGRAHRRRGDPGICRAPA